MQLPASLHAEHDDALVHLVNWLREHAGAPEDFFVHALRVHRPVFIAWQSGRGELPAGKLNELRNLLRTFRRLMGFFNYDPAPFRVLLHEPAALRAGTGPTALTPPWAGSTMRVFIESGGSDAVERVDR